MKYQKEQKMKELRAFVENCKAVFGPEDIIAMIVTIIGLYFGVILISGALG